MRPFFFNFNLEKETFFEKIKKIKRQAFGRNRVVSSTNLFSQGLLNLWDIG
jgi:hypothetical protein